MHLLDTNVVSRLRMPGRYGRSWHTNTRELVPETG